MNSYYKEVWKKSEVCKYAKQNSQVCLANPFNLFIFFRKWIIIIEACLISFDSLGKVP
jgi:hypothetical protein